MIQRATRTDHVLFIAAASFESKHRCIRHELIYHAIAELAGGSRDITRQHVESVCQLFQMQVGRQVDLPCHLCARRSYDGVELFFREVQEEDAATVTWEMPLVIPGITHLPDGRAVHARLFSYEKEAEIPKNKYTKWFDYDKIRRCPVVRSRRVSDYFYIDDTHTKTVKDYMINEKIKKSERDSLCLICLDHHMLWMPGYRISAYYKIRPETKQVLELTYLGGEEDGGEDSGNDF